MKKGQTGILTKIFGGSKKDSCCSIELEEIPATKSDSEKQATEKIPTMRPYLPIQEQMEKE